MLEKFKNIYEVRKSLRFELKPSKVTETFLKDKKIYEKPINILYKNKLEKGNNYSKQIFEDNLKDFLENSKNIFLVLEKIKNFLDNLPFSEIFIDRKIFEIIDKNYFIKNVKGKLSGGRASSFYEIKKNLDWKGINVIKNYYYDNLEKINDLLISIEELGKKETNFSKNEIKKLLRKISLEFIRIYNFLNFFDIKNKNFNKNLKEYIEKILKYNSFFEEIKNYYFISENQSSGILVRRFGFNEKSLKRRQPKEIKDELEEKILEYNKLNTEKEKLEEEKAKLIEEFDLKTKKEKFSDLLHPEKWQELRKKEDKTKDEQKYLDKIDNDFSELKKLRKNDKEIKNITNKLNKIKQKVGKLKVDINNLEKELENNLALTHYAKLIEREINGEKLFYLALIPINNKYLLEDYIGEGENKILEYNTLTFNALKKLALSYDGTMGIYWDKEERINKKTKLQRWIVNLYNDLQNGERQEEFYKLKRYIANLIETYLDIFGSIKFNFKKLKEQNSLDDYIKEFNKQGYNIFWNKIDFDILEYLEKKGELELYQIYTKDFYKDPDFFDIKYSVQEQKEERIKRRKEKNVNGNKNLFTIYWEDFIKDVEKGNNKIKLNSDCGFFIKLADENIEKENGASRKKRDKIIGNFNLIFYPNKTLSKNYDEKENIKEFNKLYIEKVKSNINDLTFIGLDRGEKELLTYCLIDSRGECIKDTNGEYLIGDFNCINSKGNFIKTEDCLWIDGDGKIYNNLIGTFLPDFSHPENIVLGKKSFQFDEDKKLYYFKLNHNAKFYLLEGEKNKYKITNKEGKEIFLEDKNGNKVINYYLLFQTEIYKRHIFQLKNGKNIKKLKDIKLEDIQEFRGGYISNIIKQLNKWIINYNGVIVLENLDKIQISKEGNVYSTNKEKNLEKTLGATIYQEIETLLNRKYNYFIYKDKNIGGLQLTPKVKNIGDIKNLEKSKENVNLGNIVFIDEYLTSKQCPNCKSQLFRDKKKGDIVYHNEKNPGKNGCNFSTKEEGNTYGFNFINSGDDLAAYNIAKKGKEYIENITKSFDKIQ